MDRIWQWMWDRYGVRYSWAVWAISVLAVLPPYLATSFLLLAFERSGRYVDAVAVTVATVLVICCSFVSPGGQQFRLAEQWAAGDEVDRVAALEDTYIYARRAVVRSVAGFTVGAVAMSVVVGAIAGATSSRLVQYGFVGASVGFCVSLIGVHSFLEVAVRPARVALAGDTAIGDALPRSRPTFA